MKLLSSLSFLVRVVLVGVLAGPALMVSPAFGQAAPGLDAQDFDKAQQFTDAGKLQEAAGLLEGIPVKYPTSVYIPAATVRLGYVYFRLLDYDKAVKTLQSATTLKTITPEMKELALSLVPQAQSAKAVADGPKSPQRKRLFEEAIKGFDTFLLAYPASQEVESANYGKAVAHYQIEQFTEAMKALRVNLTKFQNSEAVLDSQYLMALTMATVANNAAQAEPPDKKTADEYYKNAELMLGDIVTKGTDVALANESRFQIGELLYARAGTTKDNKEAQNAFFQRALDVYRIVAGKDLVVAAQKARIERFKQARVGAFQRQDQPLLKRFARVIERENEKLANIEARPDQTLVAKVKIGQVFYQLDRLDECRVILTYVKPLIEDEEQKKAVFYYQALSLARQNADAKGLIAPLADRAEAVYGEFTAAHPGDPIAENLPIIMAAGFTNSSPEKALQYLEDLKKNYPTSKLESSGGPLRIGILVQQKKYDEALKAIADALAAKPSKEMEAMIKFSKATVYQQQKLLPEALPIFKDVRDNYPGTQQGTQAQFFYPQLLVEAQDYKTALPELEAFVKNNPQNELMPQALYFLAQAQVGLDKNDDALSTYKQLAEKYPAAEVAPYSYFQRTQILMRREKQEDTIVDLMHEFMEKYPDAPTLFQAYDFVAQILISKQPKKADGTVDPVEKEKAKIAAVKTYEGFADKKPADKMSAQALLRAATLWKELAMEMGRYTTIREDDRPEWRNRVDSSIKDAERVVRQYPEEQQVALTLATLLDVQKMLVAVKGTPEEKQAAEAEVVVYFQKLADEFKDKPIARSKIIFTLAGNLMEKEKSKAMELMASVYDPKLKYAPEDMDLYGTGLIEAKKYDDAEKLFKKLAEDYPIPAGKEPKDAPRDIQEAQSMTLFGLGKILQDQGKVAESRPYFDELEKTYGWSPKMLAAHIGIAEALYKEKNFDEALKRALKVANAGKAPSELRAHAMYVLSESHEALEHYDDAINNYVKIDRMYASVPKYAAAGLYRAALLLEKQAKGDLPIPTPTPKAAPVKKPAAGAKGTPGAAAPETAATPAAAPATAKK